jgi:hypothetical protein
VCTDRGLQLRLDETTCDDKALYGRFHRVIPTVPKRTAKVVDKRSIRSSHLPPHIRWQMRFDALRVRGVELPAWEARKLTEPKPSSAFPSADSKSVSQIYSYSNWPCSQTKAASGRLTGVIPRHTGSANLGSDGVYRARGGDAHVTHECRTSIPVAPHSSSLVIDEGRWDPIQCSVVLQRETRPLPRKRAARSAGPARRAMSGRGQSRHFERGVTLTASPQ